MNIYELTNKITEIDTNKYLLAEITYQGNNAIAYLDPWYSPGPVINAIEDLLNKDCVEGFTINLKYDFKIIKHWKENYISIIITYNSTIEELLDKGYTLRQIQQLLKGGTRQ